MGWKKNSNRKLLAMERTAAQSEHDFEGPQEIYTPSKRGGRVDERVVYGQRVDGDGKRRGWVNLDNNHIVVEFDASSDMWQRAYRKSLYGNKEPLSPRPYMREGAA